MVQYVAARAMFDEIEVFIPLLPNAALRESFAAEQRRAGLGLRVAAQASRAMDYNVDEEKLGIAFDRIVALIRRVMSSMWMETADRICAHQGRDETPGESRGRATPTFRMRPGLRNSDPNPQRSRSLGVRLGARRATTTLRDPQVRPTSRIARRMAAYHPNVNSCAGHEIGEAHPPVGWS
ncbi:MAG: hypothetical protein ABJA98_33175 [Acidobacteriota bacterium]